MTDFEFHIDNFMLHCTSKGLSEKTMKSYEQALQLFSIYMDQQYSITEVNHVMPNHIKNYIKHLKERGKYTVVASEQSKEHNFPQNRPDFNKKVSDTTIANYLRNIKVFFNFLYTEHEIKNNPVKNIKNIKPTRKQKELLTKEEIKRILYEFDVTTFHGWRNRLIFKVILDTGVRITECVSIKPQDLDLKFNTILLKNTKNKHERYVYFSDRLKQELKRWLLYRDRYSDSEWLFPTIRGTQLDITAYQSALKQAGDRANVKNVSPHVVRNTFAKYYLLNGGDLSTLSRILGHSSVEVTQRAYLDFTNDEIRRKYRKHSPLDHLKI